MRTHHPDSPGTRRRAEVHNRTRRGMHGLSLALLLITAPLTGCGVHSYLERRLENQFTAAGLSHQRVVLPNGEIKFRVGGNPNGRPLVLVHGFGADGMWGWGSQLPLAKDHLLIIPDLIWFGESTSHVDDYSIEFQAETIRQLLRYLRVDHADVVGISYGGFVSLELAHRYPDLVDRVAIVDCPGHSYTLTDYRDLLERQELDSVVDLIVPETPKDVRRLIRLAYHTPPPVPGFVTRDLHANMFSRYNDQKVRLIDHLLARASTTNPDMYQLDNPVMVMWGEHDELFPADLAYRLADQIGDNAEVHIIPKTNHAPNMERSKQFNSALRRFLGPG